MHIEYSDPYQLEPLIALIKEVVETCRTVDCKNVLVDVRRMPGKISTMDRFQLGMAGAEAFRGLVKLAVVYRKEEMNWFAETVGVNHGAIVSVFSDPRKALKWLDVST